MVTSSDMKTTAAPSLPVSSFTIARYHVKFMPSFDIITSTGWDSSKQSSGIHQGSKFTFFPARTVRSDHVAEVAFRKIRSHFFPPFFVGWVYFFTPFFPLSSTLTDITKYHAKLIG
jgi:hypothetical protein